MSKSPASPYIGGQAVLEGVMMRAPRSFAGAGRRRVRSIQIRERPMSDGRTGAARLPLIRGVASLVESLRLGSEALRFSAEKMEEDLMAADGERGSAAAASSRPSGMSGMSVMTAVALTLAAIATGDGSDQGSGSSSRKAGGGQWVMLVVAIAFFIALPQAAAAGINRLLSLHLEVQSPGFQAMTGALKLVIVVSYLLGIRRVPDIRRVFQYHGAEHKTISAYEAGEPLVVASARSKTTLHPRCGTTFLVMVALVSIIVFTCIGAALPRIHTGSAVADNAIFLIEKLPFLPVLVAITFEIQRVFARYCSTGPLRALLWPGFLVQKITTAEPEDSQLEIALASLRATLARQQAAQPAEVPGGEMAFASYEAVSF